jgi:iron(III) transport system ATP-binding protein
VFRAVDSLDIEVKPGEILALLGPSGCGKTTTLRCIAGLDSPDAGEIEIGEQLVNSSGRRFQVPAEDRGIGMVFQSYALWPHMTVFDNVAFPLKTAKVKRAQVAARVDSALEIVGCQQLSKRYPSQLSGGQQQRIALARALVGEPAVVLFDEPLSNLDARLREQMRLELVELHERLRFTGIYVTHDHTEALTVADRVAVMSGGHLLQTGSGQELYRTPDSMEVARFLGIANELPGVVIQQQATSDGRLRYDVRTKAGVMVVISERSLEVGSDVSLLVRPEDIVVASAAGGGRSGETQNHIVGSIVASAYQGAHSVVVLALDGSELTAHVPGSATPPAKGDQAAFVVEAESWWVLPAEGGPEPGLAAADDALEPS